jgi:hypothetical protein
MSPSDSEVSDSLRERGGERNHRGIEQGRVPICDPRIAVLIRGGTKVVHRGWLLRDTRQFGIIVRATTKPFHFHCIL